MSKEAWGIDYDKLSISGKVVRLASLDVFDTDAMLDIEQQIERAIEGIEMAYRLSLDEEQRDADYMDLYKEVSAAERVSWPGDAVPDILTERARDVLLGERYAAHAAQEHTRYDSYREGMARSRGVSVRELSAEENAQARRVAGMIPLGEPKRRIPDISYMEIDLEDSAKNNEASL